MPPVFRQLEQLTREANWDLEGAHVVSETLWSDAKRFYSKVRSASPNWIEPHISPSGDGTVHFTWVRNEKRFNLELDEGRWHLAIKDSSTSKYRRYTPTPDEAAAKLRAFLS